MKIIKIVRSLLMGVVGISLTAAGLAAMYQFDKTNNVAFAYLYCHNNTVWEYHDTVCKYDENGSFGLLNGGCDESKQGCGGQACVCSGQLQKGSNGNLGYLPPDGCKCQTCPPLKCDTTTCGLKKTTGLDDGKCGKTGECPATAPCKCTATSCAPPTPNCGADGICTCTAGCIDGTSYRHCTGDKYKGVIIDCKQLNGDYGCMGSGESAWCCLSDGSCFDQVGDKLWGSTDSGSLADGCKPDCDGKCGGAPDGCGNGGTCNGGCPSGLTCAMQRCGASSKDTPKTAGKWSDWGKCQLSSGNECGDGKQVRACAPAGAVCSADDSGDSISKICTIKCDAGKVCQKGKCVPITEKTDSNQADNPVGCATFTGIKTLGSYECTIGITNSLDKCELASGIYKWKQYACADVTTQAAKDYCNNYCGGTGVTDNADSSVSGCANLGQHCDIAGSRACDCDGSGYFDVCSGSLYVWGHSGDKDPTICKKPAATNIVRKVFRCSVDGGKTFAKAGDACSQKFQPGVCGWDGVNHCYCKDDGTFAFDNNLVAYCKKCAESEKDTNVCSCVDINNPKSWVKMGNRVCGSGKTQNISYLCKTPGQAMAAEPCVNGSLCNKDGCGEEKISCSGLTGAIVDVIKKINSGVAHFASQSKASTKLKYHASGSSSYWADSQKMADEINILEKNGVLQNVKNKAAKFKDPAKLDIACISLETVPWCSEQNKQVYRCVESPIKNVGCYVWDWVMGGGEDCTKNSAGDYCQYAKKETLNGAGDVTGSEYLVNAATGERYPIGKCASEIIKAPDQAANNITSHVLAIKGDSLVETIQTVSKPDYCVADCYFCEGAGCAIGPRALAVGTRLENISANVFSIDYTVKTIMSRNAAGFQCSAQCWNGGVKTAPVKSNAVSAEAPAVAPLIKKMMEFSINDLYTCLFFKSGCTIEQAKVLLEYYDCRNSSSCEQYGKVIVESSDVAGLKARIEKCAKTPDSKCAGDGSASGSSSVAPKPANSVSVGPTPGTSFSAGTAVNACNATDKNGAKLTGAKCASDGKCYYAARGQACGTYSIYCQATANKPLYQCFGNVLKSLVVTTDGLDCVYLKTVQTCAANQKCGVANGGTSGSCQ